MMCHDLELPMCNINECITSDTKLCTLYEEDDFHDFNFDINQANKV
jgi:hypothetical protein